MSFQFATTDRAGLKPAKILKTKNISIVDADGDSILELSVCAEGGISIRGVGNYRSEEHGILWDRGMTLEVTPHCSNFISVQGKIIRKVPSKTGGEVNE